MWDPKGQQTLMDAGPQQSGIPWIGDPDGFEASWMQDPRWMLDPTDTGAQWIQEPTDAEPQRIRDPNEYRIL